MRVVLAASFVVALFGCGDDGLTLIVELQTDLAPGVEFAAVDVRVFAGATDTGVPRVQGSAAFRDQRFASPVRVAEIDGLAPGPHLVVVALQDEVAGLVASRRVRIELASTRALRVLITRDCAGVSCLDGTCVAGECVSEECSADRPDRCAIGDCARAKDCAMPAACAIAMCVEGRCIFPASGAACAADEWCDPTRGCVDREAPADGGVDAGASDAGRTDAGTDAGSDGGSAADAGTLAVGLIAHWTLDEATGTTAADTSPTGAPGTLLNFAADAWRPALGALAFDGTDDVVSIEGSSTTAHALDFTSGPFTIALWTNPAAVNGTLIAKRDDAGDQFQVLLGADPRVVMRAGGEWGSGATVLPLNEWTHVGVVIDDTGHAEIYVDGAIETWSDERGTRPFEFVHADVNVAIGARFTTYPMPNFAYQGLLDDVRVYDRALSDAEMRELYEAGAR